MMRTAIRTISVIALVGFIAGWLWFVWPTPYVNRSADYYDRLVPVRVNRFTGKVELLRARGYIDLHPKPPPPDTVDAVDAYLKRWGPSANLDTALAQIRRQKQDSSGTRDPFADLVPKH